MMPVGLYQDATFVRQARRHLSAADPKMAQIIKKVGPFKPGLVERLFDALVVSIIHQQLSMKAAATIRERVLQLCPRKRLSPVALAGLADQELRGAGLSRQKISYVRSICDHFQNGAIRPQQLNRLSDEQVIEKLVDIRGVGVWTAEMILIFNLQRPDVWPVDDLGLRRALRKWYRIPAPAKRVPPPAQPVSPAARAPAKRDRLLRAGEKFRPYRSVATWYLWSSLDTGIVPGID